MTIDISKSPMRKYTIQLPCIELVAPYDVVCQGKEALKAYTWEYCKDEILRRLTLDVPLDDSQSELPVVSECEKKEGDGPIDPAISQKSITNIVKSPNHSLPKKLELLNTIARVQRQFFQSESPRVIFGGMLEDMLNLLDSEYGFIGEVMFEEDGTKYLQTHATTNIAWNAATRKFHDEHMSATGGLKFTNLKSLFGNVIVTGEPVIANNPATDPRRCGIPHGHPPLNHFLGIPFFKEGGEMIGMVGISNKPGGYCEDDIEFLEPFTVTCGNLINAFNQMNENKYLINTLEDSVKNRTRQLEQANLELAEANRKVHAANKMQLQHFACMSHEIRTPLNCVIGMASLLRESKMVSMQQEAVDMIVSSGDLLLAIVNDVLDYSKLETEDMKVHVEESGLQESITLVLNSIISKAHPTQSIQSYFNFMVPAKVHTDSRRLQQVLFNLLGNSIKFSPPDGTIKLSIDIVTTSHKNDPEKTLDATTNHIDDEISNDSVPHDVRFLRFIVEDNGKGIDEHDLHRIFLPFQQASSNSENVYGGTGLGLSITQKIVTALGGTINVQSKKGEWSKFTIDFPCQEPPMNIIEITKQVEHYVVHVIGLEEDKKATMHDLMASYNLQVSFFNTVRDLVDNFHMETILPHQDHICLINEECYDDKLVTAHLSKSVLITFGPKFSVEESKSVFHFRSFDHMLPSYVLTNLMQSVSNAKQSSGVSTTRESRSNSTSLSNSLSDVNVSSYTDLRVLIAEDNLVNQKVLTRMLSKLNITNVDVVVNGLEACKKEEMEEYDIILMDQQMPVMGGITACRQILNREGNHIRPTIVFVTAQVSTDFEEECAVAGGSGFIAKPFKIDDIDQCLRKVHKMRSMW